MSKDKTLDLTDKQIFFCKEYLKDLNGTQAAIRAGYSPNSANEIASENLAKPNIQEYVQYLKDKRAERLDITADKVLLELAKIGFSDIVEYFNDGYAIKSIEDVKDKSGAIQSIQIDEFTGESGTSKTVKFKLHDKLSALEKIARHIGFFEKDNEQQNKIILPAPSAERILEIKSKLNNDH